MENLNGWIQLMSEKIEFKGLIFLACSDVTMKERLDKRSSNSNRVDDNRASIQKRFEIFKGETLEVI